MGGIVISTCREDEMKESESFCLYKLPFFYKKLVDSEFEIKGENQGRKSVELAISPPNTLVSIY